MCVSPVRIRNPNFGCTAELVVNTTDTKSRYINVPCGVCCECIARKQSDLVQRVRVLSLDHYIFFFTLTYNNQSLPSVCCSNGVSVPYADHHDIINMFKRIRKGDLFGCSFKYFVVSERGKKGRPHFHGLIFIEKRPTDDKLLPAVLEKRLYSVVFREWRRNYGSTRYPDYKPLFTYKQRYLAGVLYRNFDLHYVVNHTTEKGDTDVAFYVTKYLLKPSVKEQRLQQALSLNLDPDEYKVIWQLVRSKSSKSLNFGNSTEHEVSFVKSQILDSNTDSNGFHFKNPDGSLAPLPRFYRRYVSPEDALKSVAARGGPFSINERTDIENSLEKGKIRSFKVSQNDISDYIPD